MGLLTARICDSAGTPSITIDFSVDSMRKRYAEASDSTQKVVSELVKAGKALAESFRVSNAATSPEKIISTQQTFINTFEGLLSAWRRACLINELWVEAAAWRRKVPSERAAAAAQAARE